MSMTTAHNRTSAMPCVPRLDRLLGEGDRGPISGWVMAPWAVGLGDTLALPILETTEGFAVDIEAIAAHRALVLIYDPAPKHARRAGAVMRYAKARCLIEAAGAALVLVTSHHPGPFFIDEDGGGVQVALDPNDRFAHTLGLLGRVGDVPSAATYVLDEAGRIVWFETETDWASAPGLSGLISILKALMPAARD